MALVENIAALSGRMGSEVGAIRKLAVSTAQLSQAAGNAAAEALQTASAVSGSRDQFAKALSDCQKEIIRCADRTTRLELWAAEKFGYKIPESA